MKLLFTLVSLTFLLSIGRTQQNELMEKVAAIDSVMKASQAKQKIPGIAYAITENGKLIHANNFGIADIRHDVPLKLNSVFNLGAISQQYIAAALLMLERERKLSIADPVSRYIDSCPAYCKDVTIRQLLNHTSGLAGAEDTWKAMESKWGLRNVYSTAQWMAVLKEDSLHFAPGSAFLYSDMGYYLAALVIQKVAGMPVEAYMKQQFFAPLKIYNTYLADEYRVIPNETDGYLLRNDTLYSDRRYRNRHTTIGPGGFYSTLFDLLKWEEAISKNIFFSAESGRQLFMPAPLRGGNTSDYGMGWYIKDVFGLQVQSATSATGAQLFRIPEKGLFIVVLSNLDHIDPGGFRIVQQMLPGLLPDKSKISTSLPKNTGEYTGTYTSSSGASFLLYKKENKLFCKNGDQAEEELAWYKDDILLSRGDMPLHYKLVRDKNKKVTALAVINYYGADELLSKTTE